MVCDASADSVMDELERLFDATWYCREYPDIARAGLDPWWHYRTYGLSEGRLPCQLESHEWDRALWFKTQPVDACVEALTSLISHANPLEVSFAAYALARWHVWKDRREEALACLKYRAAIRHKVPCYYPAELLEADLLVRSGRLSEGWRKAASMFEQAPDRSENWFVVANHLLVCGQAAGGACSHAQGVMDDQRLRWINQVWQRHGLKAICRRDPGQPLSIDNLRVLQPGSGDISLSLDSVTPGTPLVSVIIPAFNAGEGLITALQSLADQTLRWAHPESVEVLVVDDASTDNTAALAEAFAEANQGFRVIRQSRNQGAYAARNRGLSEARGELLTVHDSDDWSHPQKLEIQCRGMQENPGWMACNSHWVRCTPELHFGIWRMEDGWVFRNTSSLMFRREVFSVLGYWDLVRVEADTEYYLRIKAAFGDNTTGEVALGVPLSFGRTLPTSLTMTTDTHLVTQFGGLRADYRKAAELWHQNAQSPEALYVARQPENRPFPAPHDILP